MVFDAVALPTALLWFLDRRRSAHGECDLTDNSSGVRPKCGIPIRSPV